MGQIITWSTPAYTTDTDCTGFTLGINVQRYRKFRSGYSVKMPLEGQLPYKLGTEIIDVQPGRYFLANHGTEMECLPCRPGIEALFVNFSPGLLSDVLQTHTTPTSRLLENPVEAPQNAAFFEHVYSADPILYRELKQVATHMKWSGKPVRDLPPDVFFVLASRLLTDQKLIRSQIATIRANSPATRQELYRRALRAREFMQENWQIELTLTDVAQKACLSPYHFHRTFREAFGESPMRWLRALRLSKARELLLNDRFTVTEAAWQCGYADVFSFSKAYKKHFGICPSHTRLYPKLRRVLPDIL